MPPPHAKVDLLTLKVMSESRDVGYLCANFSLPKPLCSRFRHDVRDRQTSDAHHHLMPPPYGGRGIINNAQCQLSQRDRLLSSNKYNISETTR